MMDKIIWGIIGCGDVAEVKSGPAFQNLPYSELRAVMRRNGDKARDFATRHGVAEYYDNAENIIHHSDINAVYIATPPASHLNYAIDALQARKAVYLEKPMVLNHEEADALQKCISDTQGMLTVAHYRRQLPAFLKVKELLENQVIGDPRIASISIRQSANPSIVAQSETNWRVDPILSGGGYFYDLAPHQLDLMTVYFGIPRYYSGIGVNQAGNYKANDLVQGSILFPDEVVFQGMWAFSVHPEDQEDQCIIYGSEGKISFSFYGDSVQVRKNDENFEYSFKNPRHIQEPMIRETIAYFRGERPNPCSAEEARLSIEIMQAFTANNFRD